VTLCQYTICHFSKLIDHGHFSDELRGFLVNLLYQLAKPFKPPFKTARHYSLYKFRKDLFAGITVAVLEVPQSMAYAIVAGVPPQYGLYSSVIQGVIGSLLSSSEHMTTGPTNTQSLLIASTVHRFANPVGQPELYLQLVFGLSMLKGLIQLGFAATSMGGIVRYVSRPVISGLVSGAGLLIFFSQLPAFLGLERPGASNMTVVIGSAYQVLDHFREINPRAVMIGLGVVALIVLLRMRSKLLPGSLIAVVLAAIVVWLFGWTHGQVGLISPLPHGLPRFRVPQIGWKEAEELFGGALALAIVGMLESVAIAKSIAVHTGEKIDPNQEFFAQGLKNLVSSFFQCIPGSGSFSRSALDYEAGAETRFAAVMNAICVAIIYWLMAAQARFIPLSALAGLLFVIAYGLVDWRYMLRVLRSSRADAAVLVCTLLVACFAPLQFAVFFGVVLNIGLFVRTASRLHLNEIVPVEQNDRFVERSVGGSAGGPVLFLQLEGDLFFALADELTARLNRLVQERPKIVIFRLRRTHSVDSTILHVLEEFTREMKSREGHVIICGVQPKLRQAMENYGLIELIGPENCFDVTGKGLFHSAQQALARARDLCGGVPAGIAELEMNWAYQI
jgi:sulfate permease, SulP family